MSFRVAGCLALLAACGPPPEPPHLLWSADPQSLDNPFPDTRLLTPSGAALRSGYYRPFIMRKALTTKLKAVLDGYLAAAATGVHGFGNFGPTLLVPSVPVDPGSLAGTVARLRKTPAGYEVLEADVVVEHSTAVLDGTGKPSTSEFPEFFLARPGVPLLEGQHGLLVVKRGLRARNGEAFGRGFGWDAARPPDLEAIAAALKIPPGEVLLALPQVAAPVSPDYAALRAWVESPAGLAAVTVPARAMVADGNGTRPVGVWTNTDPEWPAIQGWLEKYPFGRPSTRVGKVVVGELSARDLRENEVWRADWVRDPSQAPVVALPFVLTIPTGNKPAGGWPTVIGAHGIAGRNLPVSGAESYCLANAQLLAVRGLACLGIDAPSHGLRGSLFDFFEIERLPAIRDKFREMTFDLLQLSRAAPSIDVDGDGLGDLAADLGYLGNSMGGIMGAAFVPLAPRIQHSVLNVPGGGLSNVLTSGGIRDQVGLLIAAKTDGAYQSVEYYSVFMLFRAVAQPFFEAADPVNLAALLPVDRALLVQEGVGDRTIPNFTTENLAAALKLEAPTAKLTGAAPLKVLSRPDPSAYLPPAEAAAFNGHNVFNAFEPVRAQALRFLQTKGREFLPP